MGVIYLLSGLFIGSAGTTMIAGGDPRWAITIVVSVLMAVGAALAEYNR